MVTWEGKRKRSYLRASRTNSSKIRTNSSKINCQKWTINACNSKSTKRSNKQWQPPCRTCSCRKAHRDHQDRKGSKAYQAKAATARQIDEILQTLDTLILTLISRTVKKISSSWVKIPTFVISFFSRTA